MIQTGGEYYIVATFRRMLLILRLMTGRPIVIIVIVLLTLASVARLSAVLRVAIVVGSTVVVIVVVVLLAPIGIVVIAIVRSGTAGLRAAPRLIIRLFAIVYLRPADRLALVLLLLRIRTTLVVVSVLLRLRPILRVVVGSGRVDAAAVRGRSARGVALIVARAGTRRAGSALALRVRRAGLALAVVARLVLRVALVLLGLLGRGERKEKVLNFELETEAIMNA